MSVLKVRRLSAKRRKNMPIEEQEEANLTMEYTAENAKADIEFLRTLPVNDTNMAIIEEKLMLTLKYRAAICEEHPNFLERFPYFFTHPALVSNMNRL